MKENLFKEYEFLSTHYNVISKPIRHFDLVLGYAVIAEHKHTEEFYYAVGKTDEEATHDVFLQLPDSAIREDGGFIDKNNDIWIVKWYCGEKVQLRKEHKATFDGITCQEELMIYIYKGIKYMSFDYRLFTEDGVRVSSDQVPLAYEKVVNDVVALAMDDAKYPELILKKPEQWNQFKQSNRDL